jgi:hypothetical protein
MALDSDACCREDVGKSLPQVPVCEIDETHAALRGPLVDDGLLDLRQFDSVVLREGLRRLS